MLWVVPFRGSDVTRSHVRLDSWRHGVSTTMVSYELVHQNISPKDSQALVPSGGGDRRQCMLHDREMVLSLIYLKKEVPLRNHCIQDRGFESGQHVEDGPDAVHRRLSCVYLAFCMESDALRSAPRLRGAGLKEARDDLD